ncbi:FAD-dependent oxidoreductase [Saccharomonospora saliphila]|uniref:FAD-dependent oxidoreductase n=1 Tax=Saccharomonospora saliphila TaxID=369829 RepID=UPI0003686DB0|nr:FAD-dependent oxidoreductase [Saccharomonospora saliphila]
MSDNRTSTSADSPDVVVVGGGIGGLATAYALARTGRSVRVLERAAEFGEVGAGLQMAPNATRILAEWGLLDEIVAVGVLPKRVVLRDALRGDELSHLDLASVHRRYGAPYVVVHRTDLHRVLVEACTRAGVDLRTGRPVTAVETVGDIALTHCADGEVHRSAVTLGLDGLTSTLRRSVVGDDLVASGYVAYRGAVPLEEMPVDVDLDDVVSWVGPRCHLVQYPLRQRTMINQVAVFRSPAFDRGERDWGGADELDDAFVHCHPHVRTSLGSLWRDRQWHMYDREPTGTWVDGRLCLLGDAAHPMLQYLAQGANQAVEDAYVLAAEATRHTVDDLPDWPATLKATTHRRAPRTAEVQRTARSWGELWHVDGLARALRNELLTTRDVHDYRHVDWLYGR